MFFTEALELINETATGISAYSLINHVLNVFKPMILCVIFVIFTNWSRRKLDCNVLSRS